MLIAHLWTSRRFGAIVKVGRSKGRVLALSKSQKVLGSLLNVVGRMALT